MDVKSYADALRKLKVGGKPLVLTDIKTASQAHNRLWKPAKKANIKYTTKALPDGVYVWRIG